MSELNGERVIDIAVAVALSTCIPSHTRAGPVIAAEQLMLKEPVLAVEIPAPAPVAIVQSGAPVGRPSVPDAYTAS